MVNDTKGFAVLRLPEFNTDESPLVPPQDPPRIGETYYAGIDRMPWNELSSAYYGKTLDQKLVDLRLEIWEGAAVDLDFRLCTDLEKARALLKFSNQASGRNELVTVSSMLTSSWPVVNFDDEEVEVLGVDIYCHGYGSQIANGIFRQPDVFEDFSSAINGFGLFDVGCDAIREYASAYASRAIAAGLEPMGSEPECLDFVTVGRVAEL